MARARGSPRRRRGCGRGCAARRPARPGREGDNAGGGEAHRSSRRALRVHGHRLLQRSRGRLPPPLSPPRRLHRCSAAELQRVPVLAFPGRDESSAGRIRLEPARRRGGAPETQGIRVRARDRPWPDDRHTRARPGLQAGRDAHPGSRRRAHRMEHRLPPRRPPLHAPRRQRDRAVRAYRVSAHRRSRRLVLELPLRRRPAVPASS